MKYEKRNIQRHGSTWEKNMEFHQTKQTSQFYQSSKLNSNSIPKTSYAKSKGLLLFWAQGPWALESVCLITFLPSFEVKELGRRLLELHHASCRRHSVNCRVDSVASWFHGNCTCRIFHRQVCVCLPQKIAGGIWKISVAHKFIPTQMSDIFQVFSRL